MCILTTTITLAGNPIYSNQTPTFFHSFHQIFLEKIARNAAWMGDSNVWDLKNQTWSVTRSKPRSLFNRFIIIKSSGQITAFHILPKVELRGSGGVPITKLTFGMASAEVAIVCVESSLNRTSLYRVWYGMVNSIQELASIQSQPIWIPCASH